MTTQALRIKDIFAHQEYETLHDADDDLLIKDLTYSSRNVVEGTLFFCIVGTAVDGHSFAQDALERGACGLVVQHFLDFDIPQIKVTDSRQSLALAAAIFFGNPSNKMNLVGITGTNGKTTTTFLVEHIVSRCGQNPGLIGTVECRYANVKKSSLHTTPESRDLQALLCDMQKAEVDVVAMEVSSHAIALDRIAGCHFEVAAFTNLTQDHLDYHKTMENYFEAKAKLFSDYAIPKQVICIDGEYGKQLAQTSSLQTDTQVLTVGTSEHADLYAYDIEYAPHSTKLTLSFADQKNRFTLPLVGRFNVENALVACGIGLMLGYDFVSICDALASSPQVPGRLESVQGLRGAHPDFGVLVDYAHTPDSVAKAIAAVKAVTKGRVICVFGCGGDRDSSKRPKMGRAALSADIAIVTSDNPRTEDPLKIIEQIQEGMDEKERYFVYPDRREAIRYALHIAQPTDAVLIAGKGHEDYQIIGTTKYDFDDRLVAAQEIEEL